MNPGPQKTCAACGSPQPDNVEFENMPQQDLVTDTSALENAKKGADIHCPYCDTRNPVDARQCKQCGGDLTGGQQRKSGSVLGAYTSGPAEQVPCPTCGKPNPANAGRCSSCGAAMTAGTLQPTPPAPAVARPTVGKRSPALIAGLVVLFCLLAVGCFALISFLTRTREITGTVSGAEWMLSIHVEQLAQVTKSDWRESIPAGAQVGTCEQRVNRTQDQPEGNYKEVCGTPYTVDTGTGYGEVVQDCQYEIYMDYCDYTAQEWQVVQKYDQTGQDFTPIWPQVVLAAGQREGTRTETYTVFFDTENGQLDYITEDAAVFQQFQPASLWFLEVNTLGNITDFRSK
ncbi:MAG: hypothetical protein A2X25_06425 [Chloroflexi bacterium GWB2_49_20]|nr:MAG: hypothetical protein A2X25_06425 [Chloroflexi bacterium GWB2_49_20]OGN80323.1 MAG: hypothetical protein A2X26_08355 [Chloroflexi bacterium GWC2_49_37]OGN86037.1 MAG: hypothetical protein A2X27_00390 [Chloroflexi bacterium GWD2_49_16]